MAACGAARAAGSPERRFLQNDQCGPANAAPGQEGHMRISARNQIKGTVVEVHKGATTSHVRIDIGAGQVVTASITNEAVDELGLKAKMQATVIIKASDVMVAVD
jgi:molybdopterin-binding protein